MAVVVFDRSSGQLCHLLRGKDGEPVLNLIRRITYPAMLAALGLAIGGLPPCFWERAN